MLRIETRSPLKNKLDDEIFPEKLRNWSLPNYQLLQRVGNEWQRVVGMGEGCLRDDVLLSM